jgi:phage-related holin
MAVAEEQSAESYLYGSFPANLLTTGLVFLIVNEMLTTLLPLSLMPLSLLLLLLL